MMRLNKKGVSLAELLAVVVIMGIIAAIAIPLVGNVIDTAKRKAFLGDLTSIVESARTYCETEGKPDVITNICYDKGNVVDNKGPYDDKPNGLPDANHFEGNKITDSSAPNFEKYLSKPLDKIAKEVYILTDGEIYYIRTVAKTNDYTTTRDIEANRSLTTGPLVSSNEEWYINVKFDNPLSFIGKAKCGK